MIRFVPGQQYKEFEVYKKVYTTDDKGRNKATIAALPIGYMSGAISTAKQAEKDQWKQMGHPITHTVTVKGECQAEAEDIIALNGRKFYVQGKDNPAELGIFQILYCEERLGIGNADN